MGAVCASTLSLMDAGVPISAPVSGIAMWLASTSHQDGSIDQYEILTDIQWLEDMLCDMDFKVAWTVAWVTAIQLDTKVKGISTDIARQIITRANVARAEILDFMLQTLDKPRADIPDHAPRIIVLHVDPDKIKIVIGKWWETIDKIIAATWVKIDFEDDGTCMITSKDREATQQAIDMIQKLVFEPKIWDEFLGKITRIESYGMFVKFGEKSGLVWLKTLWANFGPDLKKHFQEWQEIKVKLMKIADGKYDLMKI